MTRNIDKLNKKIIRLITPKFSCYKRKFKRKCKWSGEKQHFGSKSGVKKVYSINKKKIKTSCVCRCQCDNNDEKMKKYGGLGHKVVDVLSCDSSSFGFLHLKNHGSVK